MRSWAHGPRPRIRVTAGRPVRLVFDRRENVGCSDTVVLPDFGVTKDLPDYAVLSTYEPPVTTRVHAGNGALMAEYAHEKRLFLPIQAIPDRVKAAFLSAEDKDFFHHNGIAVDGVIRAVRDNVLARLEGNSAIQGGGSSITQQVAKNFLLTSEQTWDRKIQEAVLALRIASVSSRWPRSVFRKARASRKIS